MSHVATGDLNVATGMCIEIHDFIVFPHFLNGNSKDFVTTNVAMVGHHWFIMILRLFYINKQNAIELKHIKNLSRSLKKVKTANTKSK